MEPQINRTFTSVVASPPPDRNVLVANYENELLERDGWAMRAYTKNCIHHIADHRTVGLRENFNHPDLQIYYPIDASIALDTFYTVVNLIKEGSIFSDGFVSEDVASLPVKFIAVKLDGVDMLRIIIPDKQGNLDEGIISEPFNRQYLDRGI